MNRERTKGKGSKGKKTKSERKRIYPLSEDAARQLETLPNFFNFGLYFNKWIWALVDSRGLVSYEFQSKGLALEVIDRFNSSKESFKEMINSRNEEIEELCKSFSRIGYNNFSFCCELKSPLIIGLGNDHPTERGFTFHWTMGVPYIPAESVKGVVRLAYLMNEATEDENFFKHWAEEDENFWQEVETIFGRTEKEGPSKRGKVVFLDTFPVEVPTLTLEITTCHYTDYYAGKRGPTEDQNPNPLPFLAIAPGVKFKFIFLASNDINHEEIKKLEASFMAAIKEHGFGAKTAVGHGRFSNGL